MESAIVPSISIRPYRGENSEMEEALLRDVTAVGTQWSCQRLVETPGTKLLGFGAKLHALETTAGISVPLLDDGQCTEQPSRSCTEEPRAVCTEQPSGSMHRAAEWQ